MAPKRKTGPKAKTMSAKQRKVEEEPVKTEEELQMDLVRTSLTDEKYPVEGPSSNRTMLVDLVTYSLVEVVENRHKYQNKMISECLEVALMHIDTHLRAEVDAQQKVQDTAEARRQELVAERDAAEEDLGVKTEDLEAKQATLKNEKDQLKEDNDAVKAAKKEVEQTEAELQEKEDRQEELRHACEELFQPMVESAANQPALKKLMKVLETMALDQSFLSASPTALCRESGERGMFDNMVVTHLQEEFQKQREAIATEISAVNEQLDANKLALTNAENTRDEAEKRKDHADEEMKAATDAKKAATTHLKDCEKAIKEHDKDVALAAERKEDAEAEVEEYQATLTAYRALRDRCLPKEPEAEASAPEAEVEATEELMPEVEQPMEVSEPMQVELECA